MTKGKGKNIKKRAGNQAGNSPSAEEEESSKQLGEEEKEENMQTGTATEASNKRRPGRPRKQISDEQMKIRKEKKNKRDRNDRAKKKVKRCLVVSTGIIIAG
ncbi:hypothetical protein SLA2020_143770 [Shorea laevis]